MVKVLVLTLIAAAIFLQVFSSVRYRRLLILCKLETYNQQSLTSFTNNICLWMIYISLIGFIITWLIVLKLKTIDPVLILVAVLYLGGAFFVLFMTKTQRNMSRALSTKTMEIMKTLVNAMEMKDKYTKGHSVHVYETVRLFYETLPGYYARKINRAKLFDAALLHDIGKISVPDAVLNKVGSLNNDDWHAIHKHAEIGKKILDDTSFSEISDWVFCHHERVDGKGYYQIPGHMVPIESRIISIADTYSALSTDRIYRKKFEHKKALEIMIEAAQQKQLDPILVSYFCSIEEEKFSALRDDTVVDKPNNL